METPTHLGFIGMGIMGLPMSLNLLRKTGYRLTVHSRTACKARAVLAEGATWADSPADVADRAEVIFICVTDTPDVQKVLFGQDGLIRSARKGTIIVDHSTISPTATRQFANTLASVGIDLIDAPVSGGDVGARQATLSIMCGGTKPAFDRVEPLLRQMGQTVTYTGPSGNGQLTKLVNQILVLETLLAVSEAMVFAKKSGLDLSTTLEAVGAGAARSWQLQMLGPKMIQGDFSPGFMVDLAAKDLGLVVEFARQNHIKLPVIRWVQKLYQRLQRMGCGKEGTQALFKVVEQMQSMEPESDTHPQDQI